MVPLARRNLLAEKVRLAMSIAGVAFAVLLVLIVTSLYRGWSGASTFVTDLPGEIWVTQAGTSDPLRSTSMLPADAVAELERMPGVIAAMPVHARRIAIPESGDELSVFFMGIERPRGAPMPADAVEQFFPPPGAVVVDRVFADETGLAVGDTLTVLGRALRVAHIRPGGNPLFELAFVNDDDARELLAVEGFVNFVLLVPSPDADLEALSEQAAAAVPGSEARTSERLARSMSDIVNQGFLPVVGALVGIGFVIGGAVVALTTYTATTEKARDFAVLKALGASAGFVYRVVIEQSVIVGALGSAFGVISASLVATWLRRPVPEFVTDLQFLDALGVFAATLLVSFVAASVPVRRINRIDPAMVFRA